MSTRMLIERVKDRRIALRLTQAQVAERSGVSQETVSRIESGAMQGRSADTQEAIARALDTTVAYLRGDADDAGQRARTDLEPRDGHDSRSGVHQDLSVGIIEQAVLDAWARAQVESPGSYTHDLLVAMQPAAREIQPNMAEHADRAALGRDLLNVGRKLQRAGQRITSTALLVGLVEAYAPKAGVREIADSPEFGNESSGSTLNARSTLMCSVFGSDMP